jgi:hypothetical protein
MFTALFLSGRRAQSVHVQDTAVMKVISVEGDIPKLEQISIADCEFLGPSASLLCC